MCCTLPLLLMILESSAVLLLTAPKLALVVDACGNGWTDVDGKYDSRGAGTLWLLWLVMSIAVELPPSLPSEDEVVPAAVLAVMLPRSDTAAAVARKAASSIPVLVLLMEAALDCCNSCHSLIDRSYSTISALYRSTSRSAMRWYLSRSATPTSLHLLDISLPSSRNDTRCFARKGEGEEEEFDEDDSFFGPIALLPEDDDDKVEDEHPPCCCSLRMRLRSSW